MFGQYSKGPRRRTVGEMIASLPANHREARRAGHNRLLWIDAAGWRHYRLHATDVASLSPDGYRLILRDGGYQTMTTRRAMVQGIRALWGRSEGVPFNVWGHASADPDRPHVLHWPHAKAGGAFATGAVFDLSDGWPVLVQSREKER